VTLALTHLDAAAPGRVRGAVDAAGVQRAARALLVSLGFDHTEHLCMSLRGVQKSGSRTVTSALHGLVRDDARTRQEFLALTGGTRA
jgi:GTP cyclohydrolase I